MSYHDHLALIPPCTSQWGCRVIVFFEAQIIADLYSASALYVLRPFYIYFLYFKNFIFFWRYKRWVSNLKVTHYSFHDNFERVLLYIVCTLTPRFGQISWQHPAEDHIHVLLGVESRINVDHFRKSDVICIIMCACPPACAWGMGDTPTHAQILASQRPLPVVGVP